MPPTDSKTSAPDTLARLSRLSPLVFALILGGCQNLAQQTPEPLGRSTDTAVGMPRQRTEWMNQTPAPQPPQDIWERMRNGYALQDEIGLNPRIERQRLWFVSNPSFLESSCERGSLYIHYVVERLEERNMPLELALLPMIESAYNPLALSRSNAVGIWQFVPATGRYYNLRQTSWYDGRRDITASTNAALDYLSKLQDMFNGDWLLALAAYNAGEGTVSRAIERNQKLGLPTDYWNLPLPKETQEYVPKLLALSQIVLSPEAYGMDLSPIANEPYFETVEIKQNMDLSRVAAMADLDADELMLLNPAFKRGITRDGPKQLLVPTEKAELLAANLSMMKAQEPVDWQDYKVRPGDSLHSIANRYRLTVATIKDINRLSSNHLSVGQVLSIPAESAQTGDVPLFGNVAASAPAASARSYRVKDGDNLWQIARDNKVEVKDLQRWNKLVGKDLKVGQTLALQGGGLQLASAGGAVKATYYKVKKGDSLHQIAKRFNIGVDSLRRWNPQSGQSLKPGQTLTLRLSN